MKIGKWNFFSCCMQNVVFIFVTHFFLCLEKSKKLTYVRCANDELILTVQKFCNKILRERTENDCTC